MKMADIMDRLILDLKNLEWDPNSQYREGERMKLLAAIEILAKQIMDENDPTGNKIETPIIELYPRPPLRDILLG